MRSGEAATIEEALAQIPPQWCWGLGEMRGLPEDSRYRCSLGDFSNPDPMKTRWLHRDAATPIEAIALAIAAGHRHWGAQ